MGRACKHGKDVAIDVSVVTACDTGVEAYGDVSRRARSTSTLEECEEANIKFFPFVLGSHGGFGRSAKAVWKLLVKRANEVKGRDWRHSWTAMSFSSSWLQRLSIAMGKEAAIATLRRTQVRSRQRVLASGESGDFESWTEGRSAAGFER